MKPPNSSQLASNLVSISDYYTDPESRDTLKCYGLSTTIAAKTLAAINADKFFVLAYPPKSEVQILFQMPHSHWQEFFYTPEELLDIRAGNALVGPQL